MTHCNTATGCPFSCSPNAFCAAFLLSNQAREMLGRVWNTASRAGFAATPAAAAAAARIPGAPSEEGFVTSTARMV